MLGVILIKKNIRVILLSFLIALFLYPRTITVVTSFVKEAHVFLKLRYTNEYLNKEPVDYSKTRIVFMFDDGWESTYLKAYPIMKKYNYRGSVPIIPSFVGAYEYMSFLQLGNLIINGWDVQNHSYSHKEGMYNNNRELLSDINKARQWMRSRSLATYGNMVVMPYGDISPELVPLLMEEGYDSIRKYNKVIMINREGMEEFQPTTFINLLTDVTVKEVENIFLSSIEEKGTIILILHKISDISDGFGMTYSEEKFEEIVKFIKEHEDKFQVVTYSQLLNLE